MSQNLCTELRVQIATASRRAQCGNLAQSAGNSSPKRGRNPGSPLAHEKVAERGDSATCDATSNFRIAYGCIHVMFRAGAKPTGMRATSFSDLISTTETLLVCSLAT